VDALGIDWRRFNRYAGAEETMGWLRDAGFRDAWAWLTREPVELADRPAAVDYLLGGVLAPYVADRLASRASRSCASTSSPAAYDHGAARMARRRSSGTGGERLVTVASKLALSRRLLHGLWPNRA
jgi:hypothetical protein